MRKESASVVKLSQPSPDNEKCLWSLPMYSLIHSIYNNSVWGRIHSRQLPFVQEERSRGCSGCVEQTGDLLWSGGAWNQQLHHHPSSSSEQAPFIHTLNPAGWVGTVELVWWDHPECWLLCRRVDLQGANAFWHQRVQVSSWSLRNRVRWVEGCRKCQRNCLEFTLEYTVPSARCFRSSCA